MPLADKTLTCVDCGSDFIFSVADQEFHASKGFTNEPKRCPSCRRARRLERQGGNGDSYGEPRREMFTAVCAACGQTALVPFKPRGDRPVYCSDCFNKVRSYR